MKLIFVLAVLIMSSLPLIGQEAAKPAGATEPVSYGLVIDNSGSYRLILEKVIKAALSLIEENRPEDEAFLVTFVDASKIVLRQELTSDKSDLRDAVEAMYIEGGFTALADAVEYAAKYLATERRDDTSRKKVLILITDGDERKSAASLADVAKFLKVSNIKLYAIGVAESKVETRVIDRLAKESGGEVFLPKTAEQYDLAVKSLSAAMRAKQ